MLLPGAPSMHELSLSDAIRATTVKHAEGRTVQQVTVRIGHLRQVVPEALMFSWKMVTESTELNATELIIEDVPAVVACRQCGEHTTLGVPILACGVCESFDVTLLSGEEFLVVSLELADA
jgi:hydrogenase nickel incorporation protein HypA/HybF